MIPAQRQQKILSLVKEHQGVMSINDLVDLLNVSHMTIRRDLQILEQNNQVQSVTGGVTLPSKLVSDPTLQMREHSAYEEKQRIGKEAAKLVQDGQCIYLDAGTTAMALAHYITNFSDLTVVTNDLEVAHFLLKESNVQLIHVGGMIRRKNNSSVGLLAAKTISALNMDYAFITCSSWDMRGITTPDPDKVSVKEAALKSSINKVLICDASKFGKIAAYSVAGLNAFDVIITNKAIPAEVKSAVTNMGVHLTLV